MSSQQNLPPFCAMRERVLSTVKRFIANHPKLSQRYGQFAFEGIGHDHRHCCHGFASFDPPCGGCGCCFRMAYGEYL